MAGVRGSLGNWAIPLLTVLWGALCAPPAQADGTASSSPTPRSVDERRAVVDACTVGAVPVVPETWHAWLVAGADEPTSEPRTTPPVDVTAPRAGAPAVVSGPVYPYGGGWSPNGMAERTRLGPWHQPEWTTERRFTRVRTYVIAPWQVEVESWYRMVDKKHGDPTEHLFQEEIELGLPGGWQVDIYGNFEMVEGEDLNYIQTQLEVRKALAPWGCLPLNPTLYAEYKIAAREGDPDVGELKLLLCEEAGNRWVLGGNFAYERELSGEEEEVFGVSVAASYTLIDQRLSVGAEAQYERVTANGSRDEPEHELIIGPSVQIRFGPSTHLDIAPLFGVTDDAPTMKLYVVFGIDIGPRGREGGWLNPISAGAR